MPGGKGIPGVSVPFQVLVIPLWLELSFARFRVLALVFAYLIPFPFLFLHVLLEAFFLHVLLEASSLHAHFPIAFLARGGAARLPASLSNFQVPIWRFHASSMIET